MKKSAVSGEGIVKNGIAGPEVDFSATDAYIRGVIGKENKMRFTKMQGIGNDYVYVNCFEEKVQNPAKLAQIVSDRHFGIGADGLILIEPSSSADVRMRIFNADGSEAEMCGNGIRCVAKYVYEHKLATQGGSFSIPGLPAYPASLNIETGNGVLTVGLLINEGGKVQKVCVNMGEPILTPKDIPVELAGEKVVEQPIEISEQELLMTCVSMGNPHAVFFCDDVEGIELEKIGPAIEKHKLFPNRVNVHFVQVENKKEFTMRSWERGSGITLACGSGACACCVAAVLTKRCNRVCTAHLPGGDLNLNWNQQDNCVYMTGPAIEVFEGTWPEK
jgi:diaminopimelate epimerase